VGSPLSRFLQIQIGKRATDRYLALPFHLSITMASSIASSSSHTLDDELVDHLLVLYASETGNAQDTAERVGREIRRRGRRCIVQSMDRYDVVSSQA
jgi:sulfite reductase alpha subunit-like flavoprotein